MMINGVLQKRAICKNCKKVYKFWNLVIFYIQEILENFDKYDDDIVFQQAIPEMLEKLVKYWGDMPPLFILAACMDPRSKLVIVEATLESIQGFLGAQFETDITGVKQQLIDMYNVYNAKYGSSSQTSTAQGSSSSSSSKRGKSVPFFMRSSSSSRSASQTISELERYLSTEFFGGNYDYEAKLNLNVLDWWKGQQNHFPVLSIMARDLLTPPVSTVASESAFSAGKRVLSDRRSRLTPQVLECLMCMRDWDNAEQRIQDQVPLDEDFAADFANMDMGGGDVEEV